ncbi:protein argonaute 1D [Striga asiatica]|uniref:Protein argonaute 1D n=1 Tax=Striga asiatica TaxID=4170 RepID=A0A5A7Q6E2_STRAF|nr:protein argonaute 1D [Striga asiatica]
MHLRGTTPDDPVDYFWLIPHIPLSGDVQVKELDVGTGVLVVVHITVRNGESTKINDCNWVPRLNGGSSVLRTDINGRLFLVKDLLIAGGVHWDTNIINALFEEKDASLILQIKTLNPNAADKLSCSFQGKSKFSVKKAYS